MSKNLGKMLYIVMAKKDRPGGIRDFLKQLPTKTCISNNKKVHFRTKQAIYSLARDSDLKTNHSPLTMPLESWTAAARVYYKTSDIWWPPPPHHHNDQIYKCLNFFVSQPIFFIFGHMIGMARARVVMEPDFWILMLAGNGRALKYVFCDCDHVFWPICFKFGGNMGMA